MWGVGALPSHILVLVVNVVYFVVSLNGLVTLHSYKDSEVLTCPPRALDTSLSLLSPSFREQHVPFAEVMREAREARFELTPAIGSGLRS